MKVSVVRVIFVLAICSILLMAVSALVEAGKPPPPPPPSPVTRAVTIQIRDDWNKGEVFAGNIDMDFSKCNALGITDVVCSFGWDDYEPVNNQFDWTWLDSFVSRAATYGLKLRPYIAYCPSWAAPNYNDPPTNNADFYDFCYNLAYHYRTNATILSYEIWNEENNTGFWTGTIDQFKAMAEQGAAGLRAGKPGVPVIIGGTMGWDTTWTAAFVSGTWEQNFDIDAFHGYAEWTATDSVETWMAGFSTTYVPLINNNGEQEPIWCNEDGYSTYQRDENMQKAYLVRSPFTMMAGNDGAGEVDAYCIYEIRDEDPNEPIIGAEDNRYLGITDYLGNNKLSFNAVKQVVALLNGKTITTPVNSDITTTVTSGRATKLYTYRVNRSDGPIVVCVYDRGTRKALTVQCVLANTSKTTCTRYNLDGTTTDWTSHFTGGNTINDIAIADKYDVKLFSVQ